MTEFKVNRPFVSDEDAAPVANEKMLIICDGLGAAGQNKHMIKGVERTSAYLGARCVSKAAEKYFDANYNRIWNEDPKEIVSEFKEFLWYELDEYIKVNGLKKNIRGKSAELLPTTLAMALYRECEDMIDVFVIWSGDSRVYLLSSDQGLQQITRDDVEGEFDAMSSLGTSNMNNSISGEGKDRFVLNYSQYRFPKQNGMILFAASDGCFDYLATPMDFEYLLERSISEMSQNDELCLIGDNISKFYQGNQLKDDTTIAGVIFGNLNSRELKERYENRFGLVRKKFRNETERQILIIDEAQKKINSSLATVNRGIRDLSRILVPYICNLFKDKYSYSRKEENLKEIVLRLPCMSEYSRMKRENEEKKSALKLMINQLKNERSEVESNLKKDFAKQYTLYYISQFSEKRVPWSFGKQQNRLSILICEYRDYESKAIDYLLQIGFSCKTMSKEIESCYNGRNTYQASILSGIDFIQFRQSFRKVEQNSESIEGIKRKQENRYHEIKKQLSESGDIKKEYDRAISQRFHTYKGIPDFESVINKFDKLEKIKKEIFQKENELNELKENLDIEKYLSNKGNAFVNELIQDSSVGRYIDSEKNFKIVCYKQVLDEQNRQKRIVERANEQIMSLWRDQYKKEYELYLYSDVGGMV